MTIYGGKEKHQWTLYFTITKERVNKSNYGAKCKACIKNLEPATSVKVITNKKKICRNHLKHCDYFKAELSSEALNEFLRKIDEEEKEERVKNKHKKRKIINIDNDGSEISEVDELQFVSVASSSKSIRNKFQGLKFLNNNLPPQFENNPRENTIQYYMPRKLSEDSQKQWERLVLRATISCGWSFNWVDNPEAKAMLNFANKGLNLPKRRSLSDRILEDESHMVRIKLQEMVKEENIGLTVLFDGWKNCVKQSILGLVIITSEGKSVIWNAVDISGERSRAIDAISQIESWLNDNKELKIICIVTDSASGFASARSTLRVKYKNITFLPCFAHQINLVVGEIFKESIDFEEASEKAIKIISFFNKSAYFMGKLCKEQKILYKKYISLQRPGDTHWNSYHRCFTSLINSKQALE
ncbi:8613_t:CDS:2, partial [Entrophospora sp. SA101]